MDLARDIQELISSVERSGHNVVVKTPNWYAKIVAEKIMGSELAASIAMSVPGKNTILLVSGNQQDAKHVEKVISEIRKDYINQRRKAYGIPAR